MLQPKQILQGCYQLRQQLANNTGRQTWLAQDLNSSPPEPVIVKLLAFSPQMQWDEFKLFEREAAVLKQLNHPQIPNYRDYFSLDKETGEGLYWFGLVQEYIPGKSLQQLLDQGYHFSETQVRSIAIQVLKILQYLHGLKPPVLHRDIKPNNLILGQDKRVYLVDFGAVQNSAAVEGVTFTVVGTSGYAPLEQFWGQAVAASDLYALGASLIHLLTGISPADLPQRELRIQFRDKVSINPQFLNWIEALSEPDLTLRFQTASQALKALKKGQKEYPIKIFFPKSIKYSKIKIKKSEDNLSINIPAKPLTFVYEIPLYLFAIFSKTMGLLGMYVLFLIFYLLAQPTELLIRFTMNFINNPLVYILQVLYLIVQILWVFISFMLIPVIMLFVGNLVHFALGLCMYLISLLVSLLFTFRLPDLTDLIPDRLLTQLYLKEKNIKPDNKWLQNINKMCITIINDIKNTSFVSLNSYRIQLDREGLIFECCKDCILFKIYDQPTKRNTRKTKRENTNSYNSRLQELTVNFDCHEIYLKNLTETYTIKGLSQAECQWMLKEIQTWLYHYQ